MRDSWLIGLWLVLVVALFAWLSRQDLELLAIALFYGRPF